MNALLAQQIGAQVRVARQRAGLSQEQVAEAINLPTPLFSRLERGKVLPTFPTLVELCGVLGVPVDFLLGDMVLEEGPAPKESIH